MEKLLYFIDSFTFDRSLYYRIGKYEIQWLNEHNKTTWRFRKDGDGWTYAARDVLVSALAAVGIDAAEIEEQVASSIACQAIFADLVLEEARKAIGTHAVEAAIADNVRFSKELVSAVKQLTRPSLRLV